MSVETPIARIRGNIASAYAQAAQKGAQLPAVQNSENLRSEEHTSELQSPS